MTNEQIRKAVEKTVREAFAENADGSLYATVKNGDELELEIDEKGLISVEVDEEGKERTLTYRIRLEQVSEKSSS